MSRSKAKGTFFETLVVEWLKEHGFPYAHRQALAGAQDTGDVGGIPLVVLELKNCVRLDLAGWMAEAEREAATAEAPIYAVVHKRKGKGRAADQYVTLPLSVFADLIK